MYVGDDIFLPTAGATDRDEPAPCAWAAVPIRERVRRVCGLRHLLAERAECFLKAMERGRQQSRMEAVAGELIPLADACAFLERRAESLLRPRRLKRGGRPLWLMGVSAEIHRVPLGRVLVIGPGNYPLMLPGVQIVQALVAGNQVLFKPAPGMRPVASLLCESLHELGVPADALVLLDEGPSATRRWFGRVDKVFMTGSEASGKAVLRELAPHVVPAVMELSGCDAVFVLPGADVPRVAAALRFGLTFNGSATCLAPRRVFVHDDLAEPLIVELAGLLKSAAPRPVATRALERLNDLGNEAVAAGAHVRCGALPVTEGSGPVVFDHARPSMQLLREDVMAPFLSVVRVQSENEALAAYDQCRYRLGASVFGPEAAARALAERISAGSIAVNDLIAPTADPRLPFGGHGRSGFGVTRGAEGLLEMTGVKTISVRRGSLPSHLRSEADRAAPLLLAYLGATHGRTLRARIGSWLKLISAGKALGRTVPSPRVPGEGTEMKEPHPLVSVTDRSKPL